MGEIKTVFDVGAESVVANIAESLKFVGYKDEQMEAAYTRKELLEGVAKECDQAEHITLNARVTGWQRACKAGLITKDELKIYLPD